MEIKRQVQEVRVIDGKEYSVEMITTLDYNGNTDTHYEVNGVVFYGWPIEYDIRKNVIDKKQ